MFERFSDRARRVVVLAQEEARRHGQHYVGTEHLLLGLVDQPECQGAEALVSMGLHLHDVRATVLEAVGESDGESPTGHIPFPPDAKRAMQLALDEAIAVGHNYVGTEHLLLGLIAEGEGVAARVLLDLGADLARARRHIIQLLSGYGSQPETPLDAEVRELRRSIGGPGNIEHALFVAARPDDVPWPAARLCDHLDRRYELVTSSSMTATEIADQAFRAFALVVVVGPSFLPLPDDDPVRALVAAAATHRTPLVVVLVDGAARPAAADLPDDLEALSEADAVPLTIDGFESQVPELTLRLDQLVRARRPPDDRT